MKFRFYLYGSLKYKNDDVRVSYQNILRLLIHWLDLELKDLYQSLMDYMDVVLQVIDKLIFLIQMN
jgi:hypothetical protein